MSRLHNNTLSGGFGLFGPTDVVGDATATAFLKNVTRYTEKDVIDSKIDTGLTGDDAAAGNVLQKRLTEERRQLDKAATFYKAKYDDLVSSVGDYRAKQLASIATDNEIALGMAFVEVTNPIEVCNMAVAKLSKGAFKSLEDVKRQMDERPKQEKQKRKAKKSKK
jgi:hypothetical protein